MRGALIIGLALILASHGLAAPYGRITDPIRGFSVGLPKGWSIKASGVRQHRFGPDLRPRDPESGEVFHIDDVAQQYWTNEFGHIIGVDEPVDEQKLEAMGWRGMEARFEGFGSW